MKTKNKGAVVPIIGAILLLLGVTAQMSFVSAESYDVFTVGPNQHGVEFTGTNNSGKDISGFTIEIAKPGIVTIAGVLVESDQQGGCGDWDVDDDENGRSQEEMEQDNWDSTPKSGKTMGTWYTRVDCMGKDGMDGVPIRKGEQYTIRIWFTEKTKNKTYIYIYASDRDNFQIAGTDIIGQKENEPEKAAKILSDMISIPKTSEVFFVGPVGPGTVLRENRPIDDQEPVELEVPDTPGTYYAFYIDDMPGFKFVHEVRYALVNVETEECNVVDALWWPLILEPGATPAPFGLIKTYKIFGVRFWYGEGGGSGYINNIDQKTDAKPLPKMKDLKPPRAPMMYNCIALVIDGGDADKCFIIGDAADNFAEDADSIKDYLIENGFETESVCRISQYWGSKHSEIKYDPKNEHAMEAELKKIVKGFANNPPNREFFLYIIAHGNKDGFALYDPSGSGKSEFIMYSDLYEWLKIFPKKVNIVIFVDSCQSGGAIDKLKNLEKGRIGLTIMTATDDKAFASSGELADSATEDFMQGKNVDLDKDGKKGDLGDCWQSVKREGVVLGGLLYKYNPQIYRAGQASLLD